MKTFDEVFGNMSAIQENIASIESQLFSVHDMPMIKPEEPSGYAGKTFEKPDGKLIYSSNGRYLGAVGNEYKSLQPIDFFNTILDSASNGPDRVDLENMSYKSFKEDSIIQFKIPLGMYSFKNNAGKDDEIAFNLIAETGFAGKRSITVSAAAYRFICSNGMKIAEVEHIVRMKNTKNAVLSVKSMVDGVVKVIDGIDKTQELWKQMNRVEVNKLTEEKFVRELIDIPFDKPLSELTGRKRNIYYDLKESVAREVKYAGGTVFGLLNGATYYTNHIASGSDNPEFIWYDNGSRINRKAEKLAVELIK